MKDLKNKIRQVCKEKNAVILAHYYTRAEVQDIADFIGDSLALAKHASHTDAEIILMCGVNFMAETCKILCPKKKVLTPDLSAGCSLADSCNAEELRLFRHKNPEYTIISYVNTTVEVKALSDICVTSGNALKIINSLPKDEKIMFCPDQHLGGYINDMTGRKMMLWDGGCHVHGRFSAETIKELKKAHPSAFVMVHPECSADVLAEADLIGSTAAILDAFGARENMGVSEFIIATEIGISREIARRYPEQTLYFVPRKDGVLCNECEHMKLCTLENVLTTLQEELPEIKVDAIVAAKAVIPILRMLELS